MTALGIDIGGSSVKTALLQRDRLVATGRSGVYERPDAGAIAAAVREAIAGEIAAAMHASGDGSASIAVGLCAPGLFDPASRAITMAVNMPGLVGVNLDQLVAGALPGRARLAPGPVMVVTDAYAAAFDAWSEHREPGRLLAISLGTGVGACVLDDGVPLVVTGRSCGHLGQVDVSLSQDAPMGPDGGRGSLEAYVGLSALRRRSGDGAGGIEGVLASLTLEDPAVLALVRAIRIAHAIYRPDRVVLLGGVGVRLAPLARGIQEAVARDLTRLARPGWRLETGRSDWHAAAGAARLAARGREAA